MYAAQLPRVRYVVYGIPYTLPVIFAFKRAELLWCNECRQSIVVRLVAAKVFQRFAAISMSETLIVKIVMINH